MSSNRRRSLKTSLAGGRVQADSALEPGVLVPRAGLTLNKRALRSPEELEALARSLIRKTAGSHGLEESDYRSEALILGEPKPTHRLG